MTSAHSRASKKRWKDVPKKERSERMRALALLKQSQMTKRQRRAHAKKMRAAQNP